MLNYLDENFVVSFQVDFPSFFTERKLICIPDTAGSIEVRIFIVPAVGDHKKIPYARVNHAKYMVTDNSALIGISYLICKV